jgi:ABC-type proline/glycine betaine transport system ATPase subunit
LALLDQKTMSDKEFTEFLQKIDAGVKAGAALALDEHRRMGRSIAIWQDGKIVTLTGEEILATPSSNVTLPSR